MENLFWNDQCLCSILSNRQPENCYQNETSSTFRPCYAPIFSNFVSPNAKECTSACLFVVGIRSVILYGHIHNQQLFYPMYRGIGNLLFFILFAHLSIFDTSIVYSICVHTELFDMFEDRRRVIN